jgi:hypothetical protein
MKKMILVTNDAQACGKTSTALVIAEYLRRKQVRHCLANTSVNQELPCDTALLNLEEGCSPAELVDLFDGHDAVVVDVHTEEGQRFGTWFRKHGMDEILMELNVDLTVILPLCDDAIVHREALAMAEMFTGMGDFVAVRSPLMADVPESFFGSQAAKALRLLGASIVEAPALADEVLDEIDAMDLTLPLALTQRPLLPRMITHPLLTWEVEFADRLAAVKELLLPQHDKIDDLGVASAYGHMLTA